MATLDNSLLAVRFKGDVSRGEMTLPVTGKELGKRFLSPIILFSGKAGAYDGEKSYNESEVKLKVAVVKDPIVRFMEYDVQQPRTGTLTAQSLEGSSTIVVNAEIAPFLRNFEILHFPVQNINVRILSGGGTTTLTVERPIGVKTIVGTITPAGVTPNDDADLPSAAPFVKLSRAINNATNALQERNYNAVTERVATTQRCRSDMTWSNRRLIQEQLDKSKQTKKDQRKLQELFYLMEDAEYNAFYGKMEYDSLGRVNTATDSYSTAASDADKNTKSDGIFNVIETYAPENVLAPVAGLGQANANLTITLLSAYKKHIDSLVGNINHVHFVSADVFEKVGQVGNEVNGISYDIPFSNKEKDGAVGRHVKTVNTQFGPMTFMYHPILNLDGYNDLILSVAVDRIQLMVLQGGEIKWVPNSQSPDFDGEAGYYISDMGLLIAYAQEHFILEGINI